MYRCMKVSINITIDEEHKEWIDEKAINLSKFVRNKIEEEMKKYEED